MDARHANPDARARPDALRRARSETRTGECAISRQSRRGRRRVRLHHARGDILALAARVERANDGGAEGERRVGGGGDEAEGVENGAVVLRDDCISGRGPGLGDGGEAPRRRLFHVHVERLEEAAKVRNTAGVDDGAGVNAAFGRHGLKRAASGDDHGGLGMGEGREHLVEGGLGGELLAGGVRARETSVRMAESVDARTVGTMSAAVGSRVEGAGVRKMLVDGLF